MAAAAATAVIATNAMAAGTVTGTIKYEGAVPNMRTINMAADPTCVKNNAGKEVKAETLVLGANKELANVYVKISSGLEGKDFEAPTTPKTLDQKGCMYAPHIVGVMAGQPLKILNSDGTMHNVHGMSQANGEFNEAMPKFRKEMSKTFDEVEEPFVVKCDVHPWMKGYIVVEEHPHFSTSGLNGQYKIEGLDAGDYEVEFWHAKLGKQTVKVTVPEGGAVTQDIVMKRPASVSMADIDAVMILQ